MRSTQSPPARAAVSLLAIAVVTAAVFALKPVAPVLSLGVLYVFAVLPVAVLWGLRYAIPVSLGSMVAFNFFFLPPLHTLALRDSENWVALSVYVVTAVVVSELAAISRRRAEEAGRLARAALEAESLRRSEPPDRLRPQACPMPRDGRRAASHRQRRLARRGVLAVNGNE